VRALDILQAVDHIATLKQVLTDAHSGIDEQFHLIFTNASRCASKHNVDITIPRRFSCQTARKIIQEIHQKNTITDLLPFKV